MRNLVHEVLHEVFEKVFSYVYNQSSDEKQNAPYKQITFIPQQKFHRKLHEVLHEVYTKFTRSLKSRSEPL